jgi:carboxymethylenebutenolidase
LDATVIYYGRLTGNATVLANVNQPLLGIFAENDNGIPPSAVKDFQE